MSSPTENERRELGEERETNRTNPAHPDDPESLTLRIMSQREVLQPFVLPLSVSVSSNAASEERLTGPRVHPRLGVLSRRRDEEEESGGGGRIVHRLRSVRDAYPCPPRQTGSTERNRGGQTIGGRGVHVDRIVSSPCRPSIRLYDWIGELTVTTDIFDAFRQLLDDLLTEPADLAAVRRVNRNGIGMVFGNLVEESLFR